MNLSTEKVYRGYVKQGRGAAVPVMSAPGVPEAIERLFGLAVIPGTLNVRLEEPFDLNGLQYISFADMGLDWNPAQQGIDFNGEPGMYYGRVAVADTYPAGIIFFTWVSDLERNPELICGTHLRSKLGLHDGDMIKFQNRL